MAKSIRVMLVDDHDVVRTGLKSFLDTQEGLEVVAEASNGADAVTHALDTDPDGHHYARHGWHGSNPPTKNPLPKLPRPCPNRP